MTGELNALAASRTALAVEELLLCAIDHGAMKQE